MSIKHKIVSITPLCCVIVFLLMGFVWDAWHPGWIVFIMIPLMPAILGLKKVNYLIPLAITIIYLLLGFVWGLWHPGWIVFLLIPVFEILLRPSKKSDY